MTTGTDEMMSFSAPLKTMFSQVGAGMMSSLLAPGNDIVLGGSGDDFAAVAAGTTNSLGVKATMSCGVVLTTISLWVAQETIR